MSAESALLVPIGYFPKRNTAPPAWLADLGATTVGSVSECIAPGPEGWIQCWAHNPWGCFDSPELAWSTVPVAARREYGMRAYEVYPATFRNGREDASDPLPPAAPVMNLADSFRPWGYDVVSRSAGHVFECSPLTCNLLAEEIPINAYGLLDDLSAALDLARTAEARACEPGPYCVVRVWGSSEDPAS